MWIGRVSVARRSSRCDARHPLHCKASSSYDGPDQRSEPMGEGSGERGGVWRFRVEGEKIILSLLSTSPDASLALPAGNQTNYLQRVCQDHDPVAGLFLLSFYLSRCFPSPLPPPVRLAHDRCQPPLASLDAVPDPRTCHHSNFFFFFFSLRLHLPLPLLPLFLSPLYIIQTALLMYFIS